jgi:hypothetical protein
VKFFLCLTNHYAMKMYEKGGYKYPHFLDLSTLEVSDQLHALAALPPEKEPRHLLDRKHSNSESSFIQPVANRYTDCATSAPISPIGSWKT